MVAEVILCSPHSQSCAHTLPRQIIRTCTQVLAPAAHAGEEQVGQGRGGSHSVSDDTEVTSTAVAQQETKLTVRTKAAEMMPLSYYIPSASAFSHHF